MGTAVTPFTGSVTRPLALKASEWLSPFDFGASGDGTTDDTDAFNAAIAAITARGGGLALHLPGGYRFLVKGTITIPAGTPAMEFYGDGDSSVLNLSGGGIAVYASYITFRSFLLDGGVSGYPAKLRYSDITGGDPMSTQLTAGTSFWVHGGAGHVCWRDVTIQHTGGYAILLDARTADISEIDVTNCRFVNNRPHLFGYGKGTVTVSGATVTWTGGDKFDTAFGCVGVSPIMGNGLPITIGSNRYTVASVTSTTVLTLTEAPGDGAYDYDALLHGSWTGGVLCKGDGVTNNTMVRGFLMRDCHFRRCTGNCVWQHVYGYGSLHENFTVQGCTALDCGLDFIQPGGNWGCNIASNHGHRIGYVCTDDTTGSFPSWLRGQEPVGIDTSGQVIGGSYIGNTLSNCNGTGIDLDGFTDGIVSGNLIRVSLSGEEGYTEDQVGVAGWGGAQTAGGANWAKGINGNSSRTSPGPFGNVCITDNKIENCDGGAINVFGEPNSLVDGNHIIHRAGANSPPILLGNVPAARSVNVVIAGNVFEYSPSSAAPCIYEDANGTAFLSGDQNYIGLNTIISSGGTAYLIERDSNTSTAVTSRYDSDAPGLAYPSYNLLQREGNGDAGVLLVYYSENGSSPVSYMRLQDKRSTGYPGPLLNVSQGGAAHTGAITTGNRTSTGWDDTTATGISYLDGFLALQDLTYTDANANLADGSFGLIRFNSSLSEFEISTSVSSGSRVWTALNTLAIPLTLAGSVNGPILTVRQNYSYSVPAMIVQGNFLLNSVDNPSAVSYNLLQRTGTWVSGNGVLRIWMEDGTAGSPHSGSPGLYLQLLDQRASGVEGPILNVAVNGGHRTGVISTGDRNTAGWPDIVQTGISYFDNFSVLTDGNYSDTDANLAGASYGLLRFDSTNTVFKVSQTVLSGVRVWQTLATREWVTSQSGAFGIGTITAVGGNAQPDLSTGKLTYQVSIAGDTTLLAPSGGSPGQLFIVQVFQPAAGTVTEGYNLLFASVYHGMSEFAIERLPGTYCSLWFQIQNDGVTCLLLMSINGVIYP